MKHKGRNWRLPNFQQSSPKKPKSHSANPNTPKNLELSPKKQYSKYSKNLGRYFKYRMNKLAPKSNPTTPNQNKKSFHNKTISHFPQNQKELTNILDLEFGSQEFYQEGKRLEQKRALGKLGKIEDYLNSEQRDIVPKSKAFRKLSNLISQSYEVKKKYRQRNVEKKYYQSGLVVLNNFYRNSNTFLTEKEIEYLQKKKLKELRKKQEQLKEKMERKLMEKWRKRNGLSPMKEKIKGKNGEKNLKGKNRRYLSLGHLGKNQRNNDHRGYLENRRGASMMEIKAKKGLLGNSKKTAHFTQYLKNKKRQKTKFEKSKGKKFLNKKNVKAKKNRTTLAYLDKNQISKSKGQDEPADSSEFSFEKVPKFQKAKHRIFGKPSIETVCNKKIINMFIDTVEEMGYGFSWVPPPVKKKKMRLFVKLPKPRRKRSFVDSNSKM